MGEEDLRLWALALSLGIPHELFWDLTLREVEAVVDRYLEMEKQRHMRAALITSAIYNVNRKPGTPAFKPQDFIREPLREEDFMSVEESRAMLNRWAASVNADLAQNEEARRQRAAEAAEEIPHE